jgi:outer membrane protein assembly factor BamE (lipoprotein component of BamABCDE complex)
MKFLFAAFAAALLLAGCASYDGRGLVPGKSTEAEVVALMGKPAQTLQAPGGGKLLYFSRLPFGRVIYKASIGADGTLRSLEQTLTPANISRIAVNSTSKDQLRELLGPPYRITRAPFKPYDVWDYWWRNVEDLRRLWVSFSDDGVAREVEDTHDFEADPPSGMPKD